MYSKKKKKYAKIQTGTQLLKLIIILKYLAFEGACIYEAAGT